MTSLEYWADRQENELNKISTKTEAEINAQLNKYYISAMKKIMAEFETVYNRYISAISSGDTPSISLLYRMDRYWQMQANLRNICEDLGNKEAKLLSKKFEEQWEETYQAAALPTELIYTIPSESNAKQMINSIWVADGKSFSDRIWKNTEDLVKTLNEDLTHIVVTGGSTVDLRKKLETMVREEVTKARSKANTLIRTETAHIQYESAKQRYIDNGIEEFIFLGREEHDIGCDCKKLDGKKFRFDDPEAPKLPRHPNCRCRIAPVPKNELLNRRMEEVRKEEQEKRAKRREALELKEQAQQLREQARALKKAGKTEEAKHLEAEARILEKKYKEIFAKLNS